MTNRVVYPLLAAVFLLPLTSAPALCQPPRIFYTDLLSGPATGGQNNNGAFVTLYGERFGASQGTSSVTMGGGAVASYSIWTDTKVTIQLGPAAASGSIVLSNANGSSNGVPFTLAPGNIFFVAPSGNDGANGSFSSPWLTLTHARDAVKPGDIAYAMNGVSQTVDDGAGWSSCFTLGAHAGSVSQPIAMVAYPGASVTIGNVNSTSNGGCDTGIRAKGAGESYWIFAGFTIRGGSIAINPYSETGWRIIANDISCPNGNAQAGCVDLAYEVSLAFFGNNIHHVATNLSPGSVTALYHGVYISELNHGIDFGWNTIAYVQGCRGLQQNVNAGASSYDLHIHDNIIHDTQCDGIVMTTIDPSKGTVELYNNLIYNAGTGPANSENTGTWTCMDIQGWDPSGYGPGSGTVEVYNNTLYDCGNWKTPPYGGAQGMLLWANEGNPKKSMRIRNNIVYASSVGPYCADSVCAGVTGSNNLFFGNGAPPANSSITGSLTADPKLRSLSLTSPDFHLQSSSPAINAGVTVSTLAADFDGVTRPQGSAYDIGAYEYFSGSLPASLVANPASLLFGSVSLNQTDSLSTIVTNTGTTSVTITAASISGAAFSILTQPAYPVSLAPNATAQYTVTFAPTIAGGANGTLSITSTAANSPTGISLSGSGVTGALTLSASPAELVFGKVPLHQTSTLTMVITSTGASAVTITGGSVAGGGFSIISQPSYPITLAPNATVQYTVQYAPINTRQGSGTLTITSDASNSPTTVPLLRFRPHTRP